MLYLKWKVNQKINPGGCNKKVGWRDEPVIVKNKYPCYVYRRFIFWGKYLLSHFIIFYKALEICWTIKECWSAATGLELRLLSPDQTLFEYVFLSTHVYIMHAVIHYINAVYLIYTVWVTELLFVFVLVFVRMCNYGTSVPMFCELFKVFLK